MKNFNVKKSGSEVILEEVNNPPYPCIQPVFTPLILTSIDPNIKVGDLIREDQLEPNLWQCYIRNGEYPNGAWINCLDENDAIGSKGLGATVRQVAKLKQPVHETQKSDHDLETWTEKEEKVTGETPIQEEESNIAEILGIYDSWPLQDVLSKLVESTEYLLNVKDYDRDGWEEVSHCAKKGKEYISRLKRFNPASIPVQEHKPESEEATYTFKEMIAFVTWYSGMRQEKAVNAYNRYLVEKNQSDQLQ